MPSDLEDPRSVCTSLHSLGQREDHEQVEFKRWNLCVSSNYAARLSDFRRFTDCSLICIAPEGA